MELTSSPQYTSNLWSSAEHANVPTRTIRKHSCVSVFAIHQHLQDKKGCSGKGSFSTLNENLSQQRRTATATHHRRKWHREREAAAESYILSRGTSNKADPPQTPGKEPLMSLFNDHYVCLASYLFARPTGTVPPRGSSCRTIPNRDRNHRHRRLGVSRWIILQSEVKINKHPKTLTGKLGLGLGKTAPMKHLPVSVPGIRSRAQSIIALAHPSSGDGLTRVEM